VVGKNQDTLLEINLDFVLENDIKVVRRITGGGAVYHDLGNINFSFIQTIRGNTDFASFAAPVIAYLQDLGVKAAFGGRNDILIDGKKISGNAQCYHKNKVLHHGTLLFKSDLDVLSKALNPQTEKLNAKGIKSAKSRVANISDFLQKPISAEAFMNGLVESFDAKMTRREVTKEESESIDELANSKYRTR
jgi:lipoate-protein ligase A